MIETTYEKVHVRKQSLTSGDLKQTNGTIAMDGVSKFWLIRSKTQAAVACRRWKWTKLTKLTKSCNSEGRNDKIK